MLFTCNFNNNYVASVPLAAEYQLINFFYELNKAGQLTELFLRCLGILFRSWYFFRIYGY